MILQIPCDEWIYVMKEKLQLKLSFNWTNMSRFIILTFTAVWWIIGSVKHCQSLATTHSSSPSSNCNVHLLCSNLSRLCPSLNPLTTMDIGARLHLTWPLHQIWLFCLFHQTSRYMYLMLRSHEANNSLEWFRNSKTDNDYKDFKDL